MSKSFKVVKEFEFPSSFGFGGSAGKTMVKGYARGGAVCPMAKADKATAAKAVHKHEAGMHAGEPRTKLAGGGLVERLRKARVAQPSGKPLSRKLPQAEQDRRTPPTRGGLATLLARKRGVPVAPAKPVIQPAPQQLAKGGKVDGAPCATKGK